MGISVQRRGIGRICLSGSVMNVGLRNEYLVSYDIEDTKNRTKIFKELERNGMKPVQKSVFWGYLSNAELTGIRRFISHHADKDDKALITHTNFNGRGASYLIGHRKEDFQDWKETDVL